MTDQTTEIQTAVAESVGEKPSKRKMLSKAIASAKDAPRTEKEGPNTAPPVDGAGALQDYKPLFNWGSLEGTLLHFSAQRDERKKARADEAKGRHEAARAEVVDVYEHSLPYLFEEARGVELTGALHKRTTAGLAGGGQSFHDHV